MNKIKLSILQKLREKLGAQWDHGILIALHDNKIEHHIRILMKEDKIQFLDENNRPMYQEQIKQAADIEITPADEEINQEGDNSFGEEEDNEEINTADGVHLGDIKETKKPRLVSSINHNINYIVHERK